jgi:ATP-binding protein involved in chromosome partitioning
MLTLLIMTEARKDGGRWSIAVPMAGGQFCEHFGGAGEFLIFFFEGGEGAVAIGEGVGLPAPEHKPGALPVWLAEQGVDAVVVSAIGERALFMLADAGIETYLAQGILEPLELATACMNGKLPRANQQNSGCKSAHHEH